MASKPIVDDDLPPPYDALRQSVLPLYSTACPLAPYRPFPGLIQAHRLRLGTCLSLSNADGERIYYAQTHTGLKRDEPLRGRRGITLHNGPSAASEVVAAAGDEVHLHASMYAANLHSVLMLPPLPGGNSHNMAVEHLRTHAGSYSFFVEVEPLAEHRRQKFQWIMDDGGGGNVVRLLKVRQSRRYSTASGYEGVPTGDVVATVTFRAAAAAGWFTDKPAFTLALDDAVATAASLGERCVLAIVVSALRLWQLRSQRRMSDASSRR